MRLVRDRLVYDDAGHVVLERGMLFANVVVISPKNLGSNAAIVYTSNRFLSGVDFAQLVVLFDFTNKLVSVRAFAISFKFPLLA